MTNASFGWPQMMKLKTAAAYCDLSVGAFEGEVLVGRLPSPVTLGRRDHWHKPALDAALASIAGGNEVPDWREALRARYEKKGPQD